MIIKGSKRGGGQALAAHLCNDRDNDHVEVAEVQGTLAQDLHGAFYEVELAAEGTRAKQAFFSVQVSPPPELESNTQAYLDVADRIEAKCGLEGQPRALVFHEKEGRRHAHMVWSRIDTENAKAIDLPFFGRKLRDVAIEVSQAYGVELLPGYQDRLKKDVGNYDRPAWQQAKRIDEDPRDLKRLITQAYQGADSLKALQGALADQGLQLANGRRPFVVVHHSGETLSLARTAGVRAAEVRKKLGDGTSLKSVEQVQKGLTAVLIEAARDKVRKAASRHRSELKPYRNAVLTQREKHRQARTQMATRQRKAFATAELERGTRLRKGLHGLWQRFTGQAGRIEKANAEERAAQKAQFVTEREGLVRGQLQERRALQRKIEDVKTRHKGETARAKAALGVVLDQSRDKAESVGASRKQANDNAKRKGKGRQMKLVPKAPRLRGPSP